MGGGAVKTIVMLLVLVVLSFVIGAQVSDGLLDSVGAFLVIGGVVAGFSLLLLGKNGWYLVFLLSPIFGLVPHKLFVGSMSAYFLGAILLFHGGIQSFFMRIQRMRWNSLLSFDLLFVIIIGYMCVSYYRYPALINMMGDDVEYVGGEVYLHALGALMYFLFLSTLAVSSQELEKVVRWAFWVGVGASIAQLLLSIATGNIYWGGATEADGAFGESRLILFTPLSRKALVFLYASRPVMALLASPLCMGGMLLALVGLSLSGSRGYLVDMVIRIMGMALIKREIGALCAMGVALWMMLFVLGSQGALGNLPYTAQRMIAIVPGVEARSDVLKDTQGSSDVRIIAWKMAFDTHAGYIRDYIWGDGFQRETKELRRTEVAEKRGFRLRIGMEEGNDTLARTGNWHNGFISTMHHLGLVGCALFYLMMFYAVALFLRLGRYYWGKKFFPYYCSSGVGVFVLIMNYSYNAMDPILYFDSLRGAFFLKVLYVILRDEGKIAPLSLQRKYEPMIIRELSASSPSRG